MSNYTNRPPCQMRPGDLRRVPSDPTSRLVLYQVCCPKCGYVCAAIPDTEFTVVEGDQGPTFSEPLRCLFCHILIHLERGQMTSQPDEETIHVQYRPQ